MRTQDKAISLPRGVLSEEEKCMRKRLLTSLILGLVVVSLLAFTGCKSSDDDPDPLDVNGTWVIIPIGDVTMTAVLTHIGNVITGTVSDVGNYATGISGSTTAAAGSTNPRTITLVITFSDGRGSTLTGTVNDNNSSMSGTYLDTQGGTDVWTATKQQ